MPERRFLTLHPPRQRSGTRQSESTPSGRIDPVAQDSTGDADSFPRERGPKGFQLEAVVAAHARDPRPTSRGSVGRSRCTPASARSSAIRALVASSAKPR